MGFEVMSVFADTDVHLFIAKRAYSVPLTVDDKQI